MTCGGGGGITGVKAIHPLHRSRKVQNLFDSFYLKFFMPRIQKALPSKASIPWSTCIYKTQGCRWHVRLQEHRAGEIQAVHLLQPIQQTELSFLFKGS